MRRTSIPKIAVAVALLSGTAIYEQEKLSLISPSGMAHSDFKGYKDWAVVSSAGTQR